MAIAKEQIRQIISENNFNSLTDVYVLFWDSIKDNLQNSWRQNGMPLLVGRKITREMIARDIHDQ